MADIVMADIVMAYIVMACIVMAYIALDMCLDMCLDMWLDMCRPKLNHNQIGGLEMRPKKQKCVWCV